MPGLSPAGRCGARRRPAARCAATTSTSWRPNDERPPPGAPRGPPAEDDARYVRAPLGAAHAADALKAFATELSRGPSALATEVVALHAAVEDDAWASDAVVAVPVAPFLGRIDALAGDAAAALARAAPSDPETAVALVADSVMSRFKILPATSLPLGSIVDCPGVYEPSSPSYLNDALIKRVATPSVAAIILAAVCARLLAAGTLPAAVAVRWRGGAAPRAVPLLALPSAAAGVRRDGSPLVAFDGVSALDDMHAALLRSFWPFKWEVPPSLDAAAVDARGGFSPAAATILDTASGAGRATLDAVTAAAAHRLARGIFTSPGAGDARRAAAAAARRVVLADAAGGALGPVNARRDVLGVALLARGAPAAAAAEFGAWLASDAGRSAAAGERETVRRLCAVASDRAGGTPLPPPITLQVVLRGEWGACEGDASARVPLVW